jgi:hypothetical protein
VYVIPYRRLLVFALTLVVALSTFGQTEQKEEIDAGILEAVFRYQVSQCAENRSLKVFLLSVLQKDPPDEFMKRFADDSNIKRRSALAKSPPTNEFIDKESGKPAALLSIDKIKLIDPDRAQVEGSCGYADWAARGYRYSLVREKDQWLVKDADPTWVW